MHQGAEDAAADAGEEEQIWREGEHHGPVARPQPCSPAPTLQRPGCSASSRSSAETHDVYLSWQGNLLRKMLLNNYLQNKKSSSKGEIVDAAGGGECAAPAPVLCHTHLECPAPMPWWDRGWSCSPCPYLHGRKGSGVEGRD